MTVSRELGCMLGEAHPRSVLTVAKVRAIRKSAAPSSELAELYGVSRRQIDKVRARRQWRHMK